MAELAARSPHEVIVEPSRGWLRVPWREMWEYRDLLYVLVKRDFTARYTQTILGPLWFLLQPLLTTAIFVVIFGRVVQVSTDGVPAPLFYFCGLMAWNYFAQNVTTGANTFTANAHLFGKVYFPRLIVPAGAVISNLASLVIQVPFFFLIFGYFWIARPPGAEFHLGWAALWFPLLLAQVSVLSFGVSLWLSAASAKYRDLAHLNQFVIQLWMYASAVIYPLSKVPASLHWLIWANPMAPIVEAFRISLLGRGSLEPGALEVSVALTLLVTLSGVAFFQRVERTAMDSV